MSKKRELIRQIDDQELCLSTAEMLMRDAALSNSFEERVDYELGAIVYLLLAMMRMQMEDEQ